MNIEERIKQTAAEQVGLDKDQIKNEQTLYGDLGFDSLDTVEFSMAIEDEFGLEIPSEDDDRLDQPETTIQNWIDYVTAKTADKTIA